MVEKFPNLKFDVSWFDEGWLHAGDGSLQANTSVSVTEQLYREPTPELYEKVYGEAPMSDQDWDNYPAPEQMTAVYQDMVRNLENFECLDVEASSDQHGAYRITATCYDTDREYSDDELHAMNRDRDRIRQLAGII